MLLVFFLIASVYSIEVEVKVACTTCVIMDDTCYNSTYLFELNAPFRKNIVINKMGMMRPLDILFYSFEPAIEDFEYYKTAFVSMDAPQNQHVLPTDKNYPMNFGTFDFDQKNYLVYLGGSDGIYVLDTSSNKLSPYSSHGDIVADIFFKDNVHFVRRDDRGIVTKKGEFYKTLLPYISVKKFVINKNDEIVFLNSYGLFVARGAIVHRLSINPVFRGITMDIYGEIYTWWLDSIYKVVIKTVLFKSKIVKVAQIPSLGTVTFDNDNRLMYTVGKALYKLVETKYTCLLNAN